MRVMVKEIDKKRFTEKLYHESRNSSFTGLRSVWGECGNQS